MKLPFSRPRIEDLDRLLQRREYDKALAAVADELRRNPRQFNLLLRQAEILGMAGNHGRAISVYRQLAERYAREGFYAKAIALYKKVLRLDSSLEEVHAELARLIEEDHKPLLPLHDRIQKHAEPPPHEAPEQRAAREEELNELQASVLFASFPQESLEEILSSTALRSFEQGDIIVTEGEEGSSLFLIVSGRVKVFTRGEHGEHLPLAELGPGDFFGEVSLLTGRPRTATITAKERVLAIELDRASVNRIADRDPAVHGVLQEFYERRAQDTVEAVIRRLRGQE